MKYSTTHTLPSNLTAVFIPLLQDDTLQSHLDDFAEALSINRSLPFEAKSQEVLPIFRGKLCYYLLGLGKETTLPKLKNAIAGALRKEIAKLPENIGFNISRIPLSPKLFAEALAHGIEISSYKFDRYKSESASHPKALQQVWVQHEEVNLVNEGIKRGQAAGETQCQVRDLMNAPANKMRPEDLAAWTTASADRYGYFVEVFRKATLESLKMEALLSVSQGSASEPLLIVAQYAPASTPEGVEDSELPHIGLVGKGITYDTGGLSIKTSGMHYMKSDMGGGAAVLGAVELAAKWQLPIRITVVVPAAENDVDALSVKPGDVIGSFSGKTIEVVDTDAEGRLVLADGISFMLKEYQPDILLDLATLTGNSVMALGYFAGALMSHHDRLAEALVHTGIQVGEKVWRMPLWEEYGEEMNSDIADVRNYSGRSLAGSVTAAKFIEVFTENHPRWAHLDIAGVSFGNTDYTKYSKAGTGYGPRLLAGFFEYVVQHSKELLRK